MPDKPDETLVLLWKMPPVLKKMTDACPTCEGTGSVLVQVQFAGNQWQTCPYCKEARDLCDAWDELTT